MDWFQKLLKDNFEIVITVAIGILVYALYQDFFAEGALFADFTEEIISFCMGLIREALGIPAGE